MNPKPFLLIQAGIILTGVIHACSLFRDEAQSRLEMAHFLRFRPYPTEGNLYRYQSDYRGPILPGKEFDLSFGRENRDEVRFRLLLVGSQGDEMVVQAVDKGPNQRRCAIERVSGRKGCVVKVKTDGRHFLVSLKREDALKKKPVEFYVFAESDTPVSFYRDAALLRK